MPPSKSNTNAISDSEDGDGNSLINEEISSWESPDSSGSDIESKSDSQSDMEPRQPEDIRCRTWVTPKIVQFPDPCAGRAVGRDSSSYGAYAAVLGNDLHSNPYHPFASKLDWEVAQWAKLRGPSSTSFADLLKIDGVWLRDAG